MTVVTSYPGVYVQENASFAATVNTLSTAVPLICMSAYFSKAPIRFNNWLDVTLYQSDNVDLNNAKFAGLRAYFESGGGPCYAVNYYDLVTAAKALESVVTLVVANGEKMEDMRFHLDHLPVSLFKILDGPKDEITGANATDGYPSNPCGAVYYPFLKTNWSTADIPPSAVMAGLYCRNDRQRGVWKAPANMPLPAGYTPLYTVTDDLQAQYTSGRAINMIRSFNDNAPVVWGARTLEDSDNWRYIPVRRLFNSVERDVDNAMKEMVFEPNTPLTWEKVRSAINSYLHQLWKQGALAGQSDDEAYFVQIGKDITMSADDIAQGKMIVKIGLAATRPAEFIVLQFTQTVEAA
ncbi:MULTISPECIES: phage tail sheath C-terminal domain-containing protein [unclassified Caballeronia]|uniref:phage tail sheath family protein n=1 Tax=unclassified Caballeronia TaxID=2646786 RepID=UPI0028629C0E|nr:MULTISPECIES: phage tail sheath C-terminal domain-containing protein [unclassified Caballeronia]MDR5817135.1 phage tail sheath C-terminal domain-containing protein [Caballeronia sp. LZ033]MDR5824043.1 phage tail sheath C-terminal domain-containing protein [Caballeronia sp. LZ043]MDR5881938.1 phage tail sheath C-terminal domain-containing protein [Caballeronia sp. LZ032]